MKQIQCDLSQVRHILDRILGKYKCAKCNCNAAIYLSYANQHLCKAHFTEMFLKRFRNTIREFRMIKKGETIALGLSGGKDSTTLLHLLHGLRNALPFKLIAITVDYGVECDYGRKTLETAKRETARLGIEHHIYTFKKEIGCTLGELVKKTKTNNPCSCCGVIRRRILNNKARELGADKLAIAHTLDDTVQTVLMNLMRNEPIRLLRYTEPLIQDKGFVPRIRPFIRSPENEVVAYAKCKGICVLEKSCCPYSKNAMRKLVREELNTLEAAYPGTKQRIFKSFLAMNEMMRESLKDKKFEFIYCKKCGEPTSTEECMFCKILQHMPYTQPIR